jgi:superfamily II DNA or RNA helicase
MAELLRMNVANSAYVNANIASYDTRNSEIVFLSLLGYTTTMKVIAKEINRRNNVSIGNRYFTSQPKAYEVINAKQADSDFAHAIIYKKDNVYTDTENNEHLLAYVFTELPASYNINNILDDYPEAIQSAVFDKIYKHTPIPMLREWMPYVVRHLVASNALTEASIVKPDEVNMKVFRLNFRFGFLSELISQGLDRREITINGCEQTSEEMREVTGLDSYLNTFTETLAGKIQESFTPKFVPGRDEFSESLQNFADYVSLRGGLDLYEAQKSAIQSASLNLDKNRVSYIIAEMGSGKTVMGIGTVFANTKKKTTTNIVLCPGHLVEKWRNEILRLAPLSDAVIVDDFNAFKRLEGQINDPKRKKHLWLVLSKETAKFGYELKPSAVWSRSRRCYVCPECGKPLYKVVQEGTGRRRTQRLVFLTERDFTHQYAHNLVCINKKKVWNDEEKTWEEADCGTKLWSPAIKEDETGWIKLGECGWLESQHLQPVFDRLADSTKMTKEDTKLMVAISDTLAADKLVQRAPRKYPIAKYIRKYYKHKIDYLIGDELHLYKAGESAQGQAFGDLVQAAQKTIGLTGTLLNGYASGLFHILFRTFAHVMKKEGYDFNDVEQFARDFGVSKRTTRFEWREGRQGDRNGNSNVKQLPGVSPIIFTKFLLENAAFIGLADIADGLPNYTEIPVAVEMDSELKNAYDNLETSIRNSFGGGRRRGGGGMKTMAQMLQSLSVYPDQPYEQPPIMHPDTGDIVATPDELHRESRNKEDRFMDLVREKVAAGEKVLVYYHWTNRTNLGTRLSGMLEEEGIRTAILSSRVKARDREAWINERVAEGIDVLICNPTLVETGLDLLDFTTIIYYQVGYNLFTMRQASRRSWRLSQTHDIEVYFLYYEGTVQEQALSLMATKLQAAMSIEGKFSEEGLNAMSNNEDLLTQIANSVVEGIKHSVDIQVFSKTSNTSSRNNNIDTAAVSRISVVRRGDLKPYSIFVREERKKSRKKTTGASETQLMVMQLFRTPAKVANLY